MKSALILSAMLIASAGDVVAAVGANAPPPAPDSRPDPTPALQWDEYRADVPKTILELQPFRRTANAEFQIAGDWGSATLVNLNPGINAWFLLTLWWPGAAHPSSYHLENPLPNTQTLTLSESRPDGIRLSLDGRDMDCELWKGGRTPTLQEARRSELPYAPLCGDRLYLRNPVAGTYTHLERVTNFLRDHVWGGEQIVGFVRKQFFSDAFIEREGAGAATRPIEVPATQQNAPRPRRSARRTSRAPSCLSISGSISDRDRAAYRWASGIRFAMHRACS